MLATKQRADEDLASTRLCGLSRFRHSTTAGRAVAVALLTYHVLKAGLSACANSPTVDEPGHLSAAIFQWQFADFSVYCVDPPLTRSIAALPVMLVGCETDWSSLYREPGGRPEFPIGFDFVKANGPRSTFLFSIARIACIPLSIVGAVTCYLWARDLGGDTAGVVALALWCLEPNILAHAALVTPDAAAASFGIAASYGFWRWSCCRTWGRAFIAAGLLSLAMLSRTTWIILLPMWMFIYFVHLVCEWRCRTGYKIAIEAFQLTAIVIGAVYGVNAAYGFKGSFTRITDFTFVSDALTAGHGAGAGGNRFTGTAIGSIRAPFPEDYVLGLDLQKREVEHFGRMNYLAGDWSYDGWWYYYIYGCGVKLSHGFQVLCFIALLLYFFAHLHRAICGRNVDSSTGEQFVPWRFKLPLVMPPTCLFILVSAHTSINQHFRYAVPVMPYGMVIASAALSLGVHNHLHVYPFRFIFLKCTTIACLCGLVYESSSVTSDYISFFNAASGGPLGGYRHLLQSSLDWGQDFLRLQRWRNARGYREAPLIYVGRLTYDPADLCEGMRSVRLRELDDFCSDRSRWNSPRIIVISANDLFSTNTSTTVAALRDAIRNKSEAAFQRYRFRLVGRVGSSLFVFDISQR